ncbi:acylneuraminate cytidylyltransferase family protein [Desulfofustis glycolicus]|uniref:N-acylneuraminate cytidylyltransferase n=1 Tax=Desulfofustis glycolicus DSM 9705 TaxID=1121409 RepID=A0A1M5YKY0_9BACT|nr:acylneuraminate cytidylyltransferase family protein [Desulfofustis glycolicus]MCB2214755.1 acylneuraminate cytidylyltransferase family protein [Desulfobulbaceae bacterium]SHI12620.1 N-acylneuraminate cytidylyltransferase [Desulfofustis glycolicus DSM 9705]
MNTEKLLLQQNVKKPEVIAIIPARGGSRGIPRKNIVELSGKPLIAYSIQAAQHAQLVDRVVVSTEDEEIAEISKAWGAEVPFLRPKEYATDTASLREAFAYTISKLGRNDRVFVHLYPTSPFRTPSFIDEMLNILFKGYCSVSTVKEIRCDPQLLFVLENNKLNNILATPNNIPYWKKYYRQYPLFKAYHKGNNGKHYFHKITDKCMLIDIDCPTDLLWAESVIKAGLFDFGF